MSNTVYIKQGIFEVRHNGDKEKFVVIQDNYGAEYICFDLYCDDFYDDDLELLDFIMKICQSGDGKDNAREILDSIEERELGMFINGEYYNWEELESLFRKYWVK